MPLGLVRMEDLDRWRSLRAEALEYFGLFFDVDFDRQKVVVNGILAIARRVALDLRRPVLMTA